MCDFMLYNNQWEVLMVTFPLLSNVRQRAMIMPVSPPLTRLIHVRTSYWTIFHPFEIILKLELSIKLNFKSNVLYKSIASKRHSSDGWARVKRERTKSRERPLWTILFYSGHLQHERERPCMERKYMKSPKKRDRVNNLVKWDSGWWHKYTK